LGSSKDVKLDIRFIFATNQDLEKAIAEKRFRHDLYFRITSFPILLPPLRERKADILLLGEYFARKISLEIKKYPIALSLPAREKLLAYNWPGNVRELQNTIERAIIICAGREIGAREIILPDKAFPIHDRFNLNGNLKAVGSRAQKLAEEMKIRQVLAETAFNRSRAAEILEISYKTLLDKIKEYGLSKEN
jgi:DNA-binding NtrC family response regulator